MSKYPYLEKYKIPYKIELSDKFVALLMQIAEHKPFIEASLGSPLEVKLLRKAKIRAITYSNQIEGNELEEEQVTAVVSGKRVKGEKKDVAEIQNYHEAIDYVETLANDHRKISIRDICDIQKLITRGQLHPSQVGAIRTVPASIVNSATKKVIEECPPPYDLPHLMEEFVKWIEENKERNPFALAFAAHFILVAIHPFADGNGRTVRLIQHLLLQRSKEDMARFVPSETSIMAQRNRYYLTIRQTRELERLSPFLEFMGECFLSSAQEVMTEAKEILRDQAGKNPKARKEKIKQFILKKGEVTTAQVVEQFAQIPRRTLERDLSEMVKEKMIVTQGTTRSKKYFPKK